MTAPSRQFMIQQAVLSYIGKTYPSLLEVRSAASIIGQITLDGTHIAGTPEIVAAIRENFRTIAAYWGEAIHDPNAAISQPGALK